MQNTTLTGAAGAKANPTNRFAGLRKGGTIAFLPFIPAAYPDLATTKKLLPALERAGADVIEVGFPFSDPIADGPVVQEAFAQALAKGVRLKEIFTAIREARSSITIPLLAMVSYSIVFRMGVKKFAAEAKAAGFDGLIIPDLPPPEAQDVCKDARAEGLETVLLVSPTTAPSRRDEIARLCSAFVYYLSVTGITGARDRLPEDLERNVRQLRQISGVPVCVGFGISKPEHIQSLTNVADGAIVGSAIVKCIKQNLAAGPDAIAKSVEEFCSTLLKSRQ